MGTGVTVVILNWNGKKWLEKFLPSVDRTTYRPCEILIVDNGSSDDSMAFVQKNYPHFRILELEENHGFAQGNNLALPAINTPYFALLNSDVEVTPNWLEPLVKEMDDRPNLAIVQPKILAWNRKDYFEYAGASGGYIDALGYPFCRGRIFDTLERDNGQHDKPHNVFWATGACCLVRKSVVERIGLFDPDFFAHMEEIDFCWRAQNHGYEVSCQPLSIVYHVGGGTLPQGNPRKTFLNARNNLWMLYKNLPKSLLFPRLFMRMGLDYIWMIKSIFAGEFSSANAIVKGHMAFFSHLDSLKEKRGEFRPENKHHIPKNGYYPGSIVWQYFVRKRRNFKQLSSKIYTSGR